MKHTITQIGGEMIAFAKGAEFSAQREMVAELFPYIFVAARRLSCRAISRWLEQAHNVKLSYVSIGNALSHAERYWQDLAEEIEPAGRLFAAAHGTELGAVLFNRDLFDRLRGQPPALMPEPDGTVAKEYTRYEAAVGRLANRWFVYPPEALKYCEPYIMAIAQGRRAAEQASSRSAGKAKDKGGRAKK